MDWRERVWSVLEYVEQLPHPKWLTAATACVALILLLVLIVVAMRYQGLRYRLAERDEGAQGQAHAAAAGWEDQLPPISLEGEGRALVDRILPRRPRNFLLAVAGLAAGCWALGLALAADAHAFLASREWQLQPLYLAAHFITLRLFATMFTRNFLAGAVHLDVAPADIRRGMRLVLGPVGALVALVLAAPFCAYDYRVQGADGLGADAGRLLLGMWCVEWFLMAFIWVQLLGFLLFARWAIGQHRFRSPIEIVLLEKHYRPFLQTSAQGATIVLGFFIVNAVYVWYTVAELSDYVGVAITLVLLVVGFVPPWMQLTAKIDRTVKAEMSSLRRRLAGAEDADAGRQKAARDLEGRLDEALVMLRISYLERLYRDLGQTEAMGMVMKLVVPVTTVGWYVLKYLKWVT
jgi:hypothetical protein